QCLTPRFSLLSCPDYHRNLHSFPTRRSSDLSTPEEARKAVDDYVKIKPEFIKIWVDDREGTKKTLTPPLYRAIAEEAHKYNVPVDRKSTRLNSSHVKISYAVFCLKKKKKKIE